MIIVVKAFRNDHKIHFGTSLKTGDITPQTIEKLIEESEKDALTFV
jgi:hypothetical protein